MRTRELFTNFEKYKKDLCQVCQISYYNPSIINGEESRSSCELISDAITSIDKALSVAYGWIDYKVASSAHDIADKDTYSYKGQVKEGLDSKGVAMSAVVVLNPIIDMLGLLDGKTPKYQFLVKDDNSKKELSKAFVGHVSDALESIANAKAFYVEYLEAVEEIEEADGDPVSDEVSDNIPEGQGGEASATGEVTE